MFDQIKISEQVYEGQSPSKNKFLVSGAGALETRNNSLFPRKSYSFL